MCDWVREREKRVSVIVVWLVWGIFFFSKLRLGRRNRVRWWLLYNIVVVVF